MKYSKSVSSEYNVALHDEDDGEQSAYGRSRRGPSGPHIYGPCPSPCLRGSWAHPCCLLTSSHLGGLNPTPLPRQPPKGPLSLLNTYSRFNLPLRSIFISFDIISNSIPLQRQSPWFVTGFFQDRSLSWCWISKKDSLLFSLCVFFSCSFFLWLRPCLSAHHHMLTWLKARRQRVLNICNIIISGQLLGRQ